MEELIHQIARQVNTSKKRLIIGISGHGASGKTTFANQLVKVLGQDEVNHLNTDPYIIGSNLRKYAKIDYEYENKKHHFKMTACHPAAHNVVALERDIIMIKGGLDLYSIGTSYSESTLMSSKNRVTVIEGISVAFVNPDLIDIKIFFYTDGETEFLRRTDRDIKERGLNLDYLKQSHEERRIQYELFMQPYQKNFDVIVRNSNNEYQIEKSAVQFS
ncbi:uridine kinase family protein [Pseudalkalibacillus sp. Hm43]|uniref:uridine kinase family protein n=1 Tax=Pseudalkalibacillus sp. Hm43 TaxID=3450742 RepID=UPI003F42C15C